MITYKVTNQKVFNAKVVDIELSLKNDLNEGTSFRGEVSLDIPDHGWINFSGEHGKHDYEREFGFILEKE